MKSYHIATLAISCVALGVLLSVLVQYKLNAKRGGRSEPRVPPAALNPSTFCGNSNTLSPALTVEPVEVSPVLPPGGATAPPGSGDRWTPLK